MKCDDMREFVPKLYDCLRQGYRLSFFKRDIIAGVTVGIIALPLAMAFAIASGATPEQGLITAIIAGFLISALGGSRYQIGGPTGAFVVLIYGIMQRGGYAALASATLLAGVLLILFGVFRLGNFIKYVPHPLITGFTTGIAVIIFSSQMKDFLGLQMGTPPAEFIEKWIAYARAFPTLDWSTLLMGSSTLAAIIAIHRFVPKVPWGITTIVLATLCTYLFDLPIETIYHRYDTLPSYLPMPHFPTFSLTDNTFTQLAMDAVAIAFLGGIESLLSAVIADGMTGGKHRSNTELVSQGIANCVSVLFGGIPATGAIARTAANVKTGAYSPVAGIIHALTLLLIIFFLAPVVSLVPLASLAAVLIMVAWNMSEISHFIALFKAPWGDVAILLTVFLLTVFVDITIAITFGMILASFLFIQRMRQQAKTIRWTTTTEEEDPAPISTRIIPKKVEVYEIQGPFFFGAADILKDILNHFEAPPCVFILRMRGASFIDASGVQALREFYQKCKRSKTTLLLTELPDQAKKDLQKTGFIEMIGSSQILETIDGALEMANRLL